MANNHLDDDALSDYLDRSMAGHAQPVAERQHVEGCQECVERLRELRLTVHMLRSYGGVTPPQTFTVPMGAPMAIRVPPLWTSLLSLAASIVLFFSVASTAQFHSAGARPTAPSLSQPAAIASAGRAQTGAEASTGQAAQSAARPDAAQPPAPTSQPVGAPALAAAPGSAVQGSATMPSQPAAPVAAPAPALAPAGNAAQGAVASGVSSAAGSGGNSAAAAPRPSEAKPIASPAQVAIPKAAAPQGAAESTATTLGQGTSSTTVSADAAPSRAGPGASTAPTPGAAPAIPRQSSPPGEPATPALRTNAAPALPAPATGRGEPVLASWQIVALSASALCLLFGVVSLAISQRRGRLLNRWGNG